MTRISTCIIALVVLFAVIGVCEASNPCVLPEERTAIEPGIQSQCREQALESAIDAATATAEAQADPTVVPTAYCDQYQCHAQVTFSGGWTEAHCSISDGHCYVNLCYYLLDGVSCVPAQVP
jgi:hypothetical protein